ncbi:MAG: ribosomal protein S18-alanine N-acetyltransferase [Thermodesulfobacteriota bacterium]
MPNGRDRREEWDIREMMPEDLDEVFSIETSDPLAPWSKMMFLEEMQHPLSYCFVMERKDGSNRPLVGFICFRNVTEESELLKISVHPDYRQLGIGKKLMHFYIDFGRRRGVRTFHLEVNSSNQPAIHLYRSFLYEPSGMRKKFYQSNLDALLMMREL